MTILIYRVWPIPICFSTIGVIPSPNESSPSFIHCLNLSWSKNVVTLETSILPISLQWLVDDEVGVSLPF